MTPDAASDRVLVEHMRTCIERIGEYTNNKREVFNTSQRRPRGTADAAVRGPARCRQPTVPPARRAIGNSADTAIG